MSSMNVVIFLKRLALALSDFLYNIRILEKKIHKKWKMIQTYSDSDYLLKYFISKFEETNA